MNNFFRAIIAGYGAKKLGGGCFGTIIVFIIIWVALGQCSLSSRQAPPPETYPADRRALTEIPLPNRSDAMQGIDAVKDVTEHAAGKSIIPEGAADHTLLNLRCALDPPWAVRALT